MNFSLLTQLGIYFRIICIPFPILTLKVQDLIRLLTLTKTRCIQGSQIILLNCTLIMVVLLLKGAIPITQCQ